MRHINDEKAFFDALLNLLENHFGSNLEIVLHDLTHEYAHTIIDIRNGHITNRKVGGTGDDLGLQVLRGTLVDGNTFNEIMYTEDERTLRCSTIFVRNEEGKAIGSICINQDITKSIKLESYLHEENRHHIERHEIFPRDVNSLLNNLIQEAQLSVGKHVTNMNKEDKIQFIKYLDEHGVFLISKSGTKVCNYLGISKFTLYNYLDMVRGEESIDNGNGEKS